MTYSDIQKNQVHEFASIVHNFERAKDRHMVAQNREDSLFWAESLIFWGHELNRIQEAMGVQYWTHDRIQNWIRIGQDTMENPIWDNMPA